MAKYDTYIYEAYVWDIAQCPYMYSMGQINGVSGSGQPLNQQNFIRAQHAPLGGESDVDRWAQSTGAHETCVIYRRTNNT